MLEQIVTAILAKHKGGREFFDALDSSLKDDAVYAAVHGMIKDPHRYTFILSGMFGRTFLQWMNRTSKPYAGYIVFPGGMRKGVQKPHEFCLFRDPNNWMHKACYVDDSLYSGTTRSTCLQRLAVPDTLETYVAFDGSKIKADWCSSIYRYYDNY
jgi:hypothetical protein